MRRALRERPRVAIAKTLTILVLIAAGAVAGNAIAGGDSKDPAAQRSADRLERRVADQGRELDRLRGKARKHKALQRRAGASDRRARQARKRVTTLERRARALRRALRRARN